MGINKFKLISNLTKKKVIALGGVSKKNINSWQGYDMVRVMAVLRERSSSATHITESRLTLFS